MKWFWCLALAFPLGAQCVPVEGEFIAAREMAVSNPRFGALPPETPLGRAPMAGVRRVFRDAELSRLAAAHGLPAGDVREVCFEWTLSPLEPDRVLAAMRQRLKREDARIELIDKPGTPAPPGELVFPATALTPARNGVYSWTGFVRYGQDRRFAIRTRVRLTAPGVRVTAREELRPGPPIESAQVSIERGDFPLNEADVIAGEAEAVGKTVRRTIAAGSVLHRGDLVEPTLVTAGQTVEVEVLNGATRLLFSGQAQQSGRRGDVIEVRNPSSGRHFRARVEGAGMVGMSIPPRSAPERN